MGDIDPDDFISLEIKDDMGSPWTVVAGAMSVAIVSVAMTDVLTGMIMAGVILCVLIMITFVIMMVMPMPRMCFYCDRC